MDPFILAAHILPTRNEKIIDVGCGCGIIPLILASRYPGVKILGVEIQAKLFGFAQQNIITNHLGNTIRVLHADIKTIQPSDTNGRADTIISNPPYIKKNSGRVNPDYQKAVARHEITLDIDRLFHCANRLLKEHGKVYIIFPAERISDLVLAMARHQFSPYFLRFVHIKKNEAARRVILCSVRNSRHPCIIRPPLYLYTSENKFTDAYVSLFKPQQFSL
ncbi:methyltransferase [Desulfobacula sp.]|uniref:tRNA1(Val) (adenine(37)-N6)-methyltransferase n=1 Tax=Desulfobacula sp. TaxID=2593537 RepID=UPI00260B1971|nr:methyltransferase [Desulfobacula sp.]